MNYKFLNEYFYFDNYTANEDYDYEPLPPDQEISLCGSQDTFAQSNRSLTWVQPSSSSEAHQSVSDSTAKTFLQQKQDLQNPTQPFLANSNSLQQVIDDENGTKNHLSFCTQTSAQQVPCFGAQNHDKLHLLNLPLQSQQNPNVLLVQHRDPFCGVKNILQPSCQSIPTEGANMDSIATVPTTPSRDLYFSGKAVGDLFGELGTLSDGPGEGLDVSEESVTDQDHPEQQAVSSIALKAGSKRSVDAMALKDESVDSGSKKKKDNSENVRMYKQKLTGDPQKDKRIKNSMKQKKIRDRDKKKKEEMEENIKSLQRQTKVLMDDNIQLENRNIQQEKIIIQLKKVIHGKDLKIHLRDGENIQLQKDNVQLKEENIQLREDLNGHRNS